MREVKKLLKAFVYAGRGIAVCAASERNYRIHIAAVVTVVIFAVLYGVTPGEAAVLALTMALVLGLEAVNTAVEAAVDLASDKQSELARIAKDAAAGAVLTAAIGAVAVAVFVFGDYARLAPTLETILKYWYVALLYIAVMTVFVFVIKYKKKSER